MTKGTHGLDTVSPAGNRLYRYDLDENNNKYIIYNNSTKLLIKSE